MKMPRTRQEFEQVCQDQFERGRQLGAEVEKRRLEEDFLRREKEANLKALNSLGQMIGAMAEASQALHRSMYGGRGT